MMQAAAGLLLVIGLCVAATPAHAQAAGGPCENCGTVTRIELVDIAAQWTPLGTMPSTVFGGGDPSSQPGRVSAQYQIGRDGSNQGQVLLGAAGGATYARRPDSGRDKRWQVTVKMDQSAAPRVLVQPYEPSLQEGDRVRVFGTQIELIQS